MKRTSVVQLRGDEGLEVLDEEGNVLFSWGGQPVSVPEYTDPWHVDYGHIASGLLDFPEVKSIVGSIKALTDWSTDMDNAWIEVGNCVDRSTIGFRLYFRDLSRLMDEVELDASKTASLRHFMTFIVYGAIDVDFVRGVIGDPVMRLLTHDICEDWPRETFQRMAREALNEYERNTTDKAFFKQIFESPALSEFRKHFDDAISGYLRLKKVLETDEIRSWIIKQLREAKLSPDDAEEFVETVYEQFWEDAACDFPMLIG